MLVICAWCPVDETVDRLLEHARLNLEARHFEAAEKLSASDAYHYLLTVLELRGVRVSHGICCDCYSKVLGPKQIELRLN